MKEVVSEHTVMLLDRKYNFLIHSPVGNFMLDLKHFVEFITQDELITPFTKKLIQQLLNKHKEYQQENKIESEMSSVIKNDLIAFDSEFFDDSDAKRAEGRENDWFVFTFAYFDEIIERGPESRIIVNMTDIMEDKTPVGDLVKILRTKINNYEEMDENGEHKRRIPPEIASRFNDLELRHRFTFRDWVNYRRISPAVDLTHLLEEIKRINPGLEFWAGFDDLSVDQKLAFHMRERQYSWITDLTYGIIIDYAAYRPNHFDERRINKILRDKKQQVKRVYEALRQEIGTTRLHFQLLERYRSRTHWYNQSHLQRALLDQEGKFRSNKEDILIRDIAVYLHDQGITAFYRQRFDKREIELIEHETNQPMFIEAKVYKDAKAKRDLIAGFHQIHAYLSGYEGHKTINEGFYIVYRVGGPLYDFPRRINTNRFTIYTLLVDIAPGVQNGRKPQQPIMITEDEIVKSFNKPVDK